MQLSLPRVSVSVLCLCLASCAVAPPPKSLPPVVPAATAPADLTPGFAEKEPDTCKSAGLQVLVGQPSGMLRTVPMTGSVRMIFPGTVYDQEEYRSDRANVFVDSGGIITRINCG